MAQIQFLCVFVFTLLISGGHCWREVSKCTKTAIDPFANNQHGLNQAPNTLELNCDSDLIFIAWSHYGHRDQKLQRKQNTFLNSIIPQSDDSCYFSPKDCMVNVDYVANECNGMSNCHISLDSQYLHSCKSYSDYLFIVYQCIETKSTVDICDTTDRMLDTAELADNTLYINSPNYPIEYDSNKNCQCSMKSSGNTQIELLEFDLESSFEKASTACTKDYLMFSNQTDSKKCSTLAPFTNIPQDRYNNGKEITSLKFHSDDALTRRGFWVKIKPSDVVNCPADFILVDNTCVRVFNEELTWYEAHNYCNGMGYSLAMIDNFELDKQLNNALFNSEEVLIPHGNDLLNKKNKQFWTGLKHLNETTWFNYKNEPLRLRPDEENWWPWLVVDSSTYQKGSCVAKRASWMFLEDCYKRMPFACQYNQPATSSDTFKPKSIQLKCGADSLKYFQSLTTTTTTTTSGTTTSETTTGTTAKDQLVQSEKILSEDQIKTLINHEEPVNSVFHKVRTNSNLVDSDSSVLIGLVCSITLLIAFINTLVILFICKRRKLLLSHDTSDKASKSSQDTMSSGHNINFDDMTVAGTNSSSSLTFNPNTKNNSLFYPIESGKTQTLFFPPGGRMQLGGIGSTNTMANNTFMTTLSNATSKKSMTKNQRSNSKHVLNPQDPLSHIYETISVSEPNPNNQGNFNTNQRNLNNHYNMLNYYHLHQNNQQNTYNDIESDFDPNNVNYNDLSMTDSSGSHKSQDYFIKTAKSSHKMPSSAWHINQLVNTQGRNNANSHIQFDHQQNRFSDLNLSHTNTSSQSPSSTTTTITDYINPVNGQFIPQSQFLISHNNFQLQQQQQQQFGNCDNQLNNQSAFTKINGASNMQSMGRNSFKILNNGLSQHDLHRFNPNQTDNNNVPFNCLANQIEAVV